MSILYIISGVDKMSSPHLFDNLSMVRLKRKIGNVEYFSLNCRLIKVTYTGNNAVK